MTTITLGELKQQPAGFKAFIPHKFPPSTGFTFAPSILKKDNTATRLLGKLDGIAKLLPNIDFFLLMYLRKDAAASSQIEGTMATMVDAIVAAEKIDTDIPQDVDDILHYIKALNYGMQRVTTENFPLSLRFIRELHTVLMDKARATHFAAPGEFRSSQNWIGGTRPANARFVPPPTAEMHKALSDLESFIHADDSIPTVIKAGLLHAQFETIHPFLDGNGRTGRMLISFYLWQEKFLELPLLFLSSYFKKNRQTYYEKLTAYHHNDVTAWIDFFLDGVIEIAQEAIDIADKITRLRAADMAKLQILGKRAAESAAMVMPKLYGQPIVNVATVQKWTGFQRAGAGEVINRLIEMGILTPRYAGKKYGQSYIYKEYVDIFVGNE